MGAGSLRKGRRGHPDNIIFILKFEVTEMGVFGEEMLQENFALAGQQLGSSFGEGLSFEGHTSENKVGLRAGFGKNYASRGMARFALSSTVNFYIR